jgi:hypothetical protein
MTEPRRRGDTTWLGALIYSVLVGASVLLGPLYSGSV